MIHVLLLGATGYVGGALLKALKDHHPEFKYTALVRSPEALALVAQAGAGPVQGTFAEHAKLTELSAASDIVINAADSDDGGLVAALLLGLRRRRDEGRGVGTFLHVSGTGLFLDGRRDGRADPHGKIWDDGDVEVMKSISPAMIHGPVDYSILKAGEEGYVNTFIACPPLIYGIGVGPVTQTSLAYKFLINSILTYGRGFVIGEGTNVIDIVHINDFIALIMLIFEQALTAGGKLLDSTSPYERYYIAGTRTITYQEIFTAITKALHRKAVIASGDVVSVDFKDIDQFAVFAAANSRTRCRRGYELGWRPMEKSFEETVYEDIEKALSEGVGQKVLSMQPWTSEEVAKQAEIAKDVLAAT